MQWLQVVVELIHATRHAGISLLTSHILQQMAGQFVSTEKGDLEPEKRVYSIMEGKAMSTHNLLTVMIRS
jgi:hypothetical protein